MAIERRIRIAEWVVPYDDAVEEVTLRRKLADIFSATPGDDTDCMNSRCILAQRTDHIFPHPVFIVSTIKTRVYIVDRLNDNGEPAHAVRYELTEADGKLIEAHDRYGAAQPGILRLKAPRDPKGSEKRRASTKGRFADGDGRYSGDGTATRDQRPVTGRGANARYQVAVGALTMNKSK